MIFREFLYFRKSDRKVILALLCAIALVLCVIFLTGEATDATEGLTLADSLTGDTGYVKYYRGSRSPDGYRPTSAFRSRVQRVERFPFDPNTADSATLARLGFRHWQIRNLQKYRSAGGIFRQPDDLSRLYGMQERQFQELRPYVRIASVSSAKRPLATGADSIRRPREEFQSHKIGEGETVELNTSDTTALMTVPGIGSYYARRIVQYRQRLGGYVSVSQLDEIANFPVEAKRFFSISSANPVKLDINRLSLDELRRHPYVNFYQAKTITEYRRLHGPIKSLSDLRLSKDFPQEAIDRLTPYVAY